MHWTSTKCFRANDKIHRKLGITINVWVYNTIFWGEAYMYANGWLVSNFVRFGYINEMFQLLKLRKI